MGGRGRKGRTEVKMSKGIDGKGKGRGSEQKGVLGVREGTRR